MKRILVPSDCSEASTNALKFATDLSAKSHARVYVLRVIKTHGGAYFNKEGEIVEDHAHDIQQYIDRKKIETISLQKWAGEINPEAVQVLKYGGVADTILETIEKYKISLVVMGNRFNEQGDEPYRLFGDLTSHLINNSKAPVLSLKSALSTMGLKHIVYAGNFDGSLSYFDVLQDIHHFYGTRVDLLQINLSGSSEEEVYENMDYFARVNMIKNYSRNIHFAKDYATGTLQWISENPCDLLALKRSRNSGSQLFMPKLARNYLRNHKVSTLIYND